MSNDKTSATTAAGPVLSEGLGPLLAEADMEALAAVAHQAGLSGIDLHALARVLDAAQRIAVAAERERWAKKCDEVAAVLRRDPDEKKQISAHMADWLARELRA